MSDKIVIPETISKEVANKAAIWIFSHEEDFREAELSKDGKLVANLVKELKTNIHKWIEEEKSGVGIVEKA